MNGLAFNCVGDLMAALLFTFCFLLAKEALGHFSEEFLGRAGGVELWHHQTAAGGKLIRSETLGGGKRPSACRQKGEGDARGK